MTGAGAAAPGVFAGTADVIAVGMLVIEFAMLRQALLRGQVRLYALQSLLVSVLAVVVAATEHLPELYVLAGLSFVLKVLIVPYLVLRLMRDTSDEIAGSAVTSVATAVLVSIVVAAFGFFTVSSLHLPSQVLPTTALAIAVGVVLAAFVVMAVRRDVVSQAIGFFCLENGVSLASLVVAAGLPLILEVAFLFDLLVAVVVFGVLMRVHHRRSASLSTVAMTRLHG
jgi:hydrogenase-4 component E